MLLRTDAHTQRVWVLGNGQLGDMLAHAGQAINVEVKPIGVDAEALPKLEATDWVTAEQELWPDTPATRQLSTHDRFINHHVFGEIADRLTQKQRIDSLGLSTARWCAVESGMSAEDLFAQLGERVLLKRRTGGYDGKGQHWLIHGGEASEQAIPEGWHGECIAEAGIDFDEEVSLVAARDAKGAIYTYPLALNKHVNGVLSATLAGLPRLEAYHQQAEHMLGSLLAAFDYQGVMAMECFRVGDRLLINELAPRVHNSGHWTQAGASIDQFSMHLRAICGLPMSQPCLKAPTVMINLLGTEYNPQWLSVPGAELYWYRKTPRPGRKLGHINLASHSRDQIIEGLQVLASTLPTWYEAPIEWAIDALVNG